MNTTTTKTLQLTGRTAISYAEAHDLTLSMYNSPIEDARDGLTVEEASEIAREDASLIWLAVEVSGDVRAICDLAKQDTAGDVDDSYARTGDATDTIERWLGSAKDGGDRDLVETIERMGIGEAAALYQAERERMAKVAAAQAKNIGRGDL